MAVACTVEDTGCGNGLAELCRCIIRFASDQQREVESLVQLHFSAVAHRTNEIIRVLTVLSAIFLPLTFIAGVFGMDFRYTPELGMRYADFITLGVMAAPALGLPQLFRYKRWL